MCMKVSWSPDLNSKCTCLYMTLNGLQGFIDSLLTERRVICLYIWLEAHFSEAISKATILMSQTDSIHESFYDLFNQRFRRIDNPEGATFFANIAIGAHTKPCCVNPKFQCVIVIKESEVQRTPAPFLNRFEKYSITHGGLLKRLLQKLPPCISSIIQLAVEKVCCVIFTCSRIKRIHCCYQLAI